MAGHLKSNIKVDYYDKQGYIYGEIIRQYRWIVTKDSISKFLKLYKETISLQNQTGKDGKRRTIASDDKKIERLCIGDKRKSSGCIQGEMKQASVMLSLRTDCKDSV